MREIRSFLKIDRFNYYSSRIFHNSYATRHCKTEKGFLPEFFHYLFRENQMFLSGIIQMRFQMEISSKQSNLLWVHQLQYSDSGKFEGTYTNYTNLIHLQINCLSCKLSWMIQKKDSFDRMKLKLVLNFLKLQKKSSKVLFLCLLQSFCFLSSLKDFFLMFVVLLISKNFIMSFSCCFCSLCLFGKLASGIKIVVQFWGTFIEF